MKKILFSILFALLASSNHVNAKHIFGADLSYTCLSGLNYEVTLTLYGDCSGNPSYTNLFSASPKLVVQNGNTVYASYQMAPFGTPGIEVTPVCSAQLSNTNCNGGTIPGITRFIFKTQVTLPYTNSNWRFIFDGDLGPQGGSAGRSTLITNIVQASNGSSVMRLEAMLNNNPAVGGGTNNSAQYTTIPTPFFCINIGQQYNQGAMDADGDVISYELVEGLEQGGAGISYLAPYTYTDPLPVQAGSYQFNTSTGQMNFTPNMVSNNLVVTKVSEIRNGVVVGTTMREMVFVIQNNCNNQSPLGSISTANSGSVNSTGTDITICNGQTNNLQFTIQGTDPDSQNINVSVNGLGGSSSFITSTIVNNNTKNPQIIVNVSVPNPFVTGDYTFFVTYQDDGCPLSSKQTTAYTVHLVNPFTLSPLTTEETCSPGGDATIQINGSSSNPGSLLYSLDNVTNQNTNLFGNLTAGNYTVYVIDALGCKANLPVVIAPTLLPKIDSMRVKDISCFGEVDGSIQLFITATGGYTATLQPTAQISTSGSFSNLNQGVYTLSIVDGQGCSISTTAQIINPPPIGFASLNLFPTTCDKQNGKIVVTSNLSDGVYYFLKPGIGYSSDGIYEDLSSNTYTLSVRNANGCSHDTSFFLAAIPNNFSAYTTHQDLPCQGAGNEGNAEVFASGGTGPYTYLWTSREMPPSDSKVITNLYYGWYFVTSTDALGCETKDTVYIKPGNCCENIFAPDVFTPNGDGHNDTWHVISSTGIQVEQFKIYNRWGQKIWDAEDQRAVWDGRQKDRIVETGTYFYLLHYTCLSDGKKYLKKGEINVIN